jgi:hypothetical protein
MEKERKEKERSRDAFIAWLRIDPKIVIIGLLIMVVALAAACTYILATAGAFQVKCNNHWREQMLECDPACAGAPAFTEQYPPYQIIEDATGTTLWPTE